MKYLIAIAAVILVITACKGKDPVKSPPAGVGDVTVVQKPPEFQPGLFNKNKSIMQEGTIYHGNVRSKRFHAPKCKHYQCKNCKRTFTSIVEAESVGFRPHRCVE